MQSAECRTKEGQGPSVVAPAGSRAAPPPDGAATASGHGGGSPPLNYAPVLPPRPSVLWAYATTGIGVVLGMGLSVTIVAWNWWASEVIRIPRLWYAEQ